MSFSNVKVNLSGIELPIAPLLNLIHEHPRLLDLNVITENKSDIRFIAKFGSKNSWIYDAEMSDSTTKRNLDVLLYKFSLWYLELNEPGMMIDYYKAIKADSLLIPLCHSIIKDYKSEGAKYSLLCKIRMQTLTGRQAKALLSKTYQALAYTYKPANFHKADSLNIISEKINFCEKALAVDKKNYGANYGLFLIYSRDTSGRRYKEKCLKLEPKNFNNIYFITDSLNHTILNPVRIPNSLALASAEKIFLHFLERYRNVKFSASKPKLYYEMAGYYSVVLDLPIWHKRKTLDSTALKFAYYKAKTYLLKAIAYELDSVKEMEYNNLSEYYNKLAYVNEQYILNRYLNNNMNFGNTDTLCFYLSNQFYNCTKALEISKNNFWAYSTLAEYYALKSKTDTLPVGKKAMYIKKFNDCKTYAEKLSIGEYSAAEYDTLLPYNFVLPIKGCVKLSESQKVLIHLNGINGL